MFSFLFIKKLIYRLILFSISIINCILLSIFGKFYKRIVERLFNVYVYVIKLLTVQTNQENLLNDTILRLERTENKLTSLQNQMVCIQKHLHELELNTSQSTSHTQTTVPIIPKMSKFGPNCRSTENSSINKWFSENKRPNDSGLSSKLLFQLLSGQTEESSKTRIKSEESNKRLNHSKSQCHCNCHTNNH